jgi:hypothetical protein
MVYLLKMVIFHGYVKQPEGRFIYREILIHSSHIGCVVIPVILIDSIQAARASAFKTCGVLQHISKMAATCVQRSVVFTCQVPLYDWLPVWCDIL